VIAPGVGETLPRPRPQEHLERLVEARALVLGIDAEPSVLVLEVARAHTQVETAAREHVHHGVVLGHPQGVRPSSAG